MAHKLSGLSKQLKRPKFARLYLRISLAILALTTLLWSYLGARLQNGNADQLVNSYLLESSGTFHNAYFPSQHTFIFKWPLFFLIKLFGATNLVFEAFTVGIVLVTVGALTYILYRIERRRYVFGTLCLALASVLLLVPAVPHPGALLPVNMAMTTTRNLEYVLYIAAILMLVRSPRIKSRSFNSAVLLIGLLALSDKLFLGLSLAGAVAAVISYAITRRWKLLNLSLNWLVASIYTLIIVTALLWITNAAGWTNIASSQPGFGPYGFVHSVQSLALGGLYGVLGILTNFGANPAYDSLVVRDIPHQALGRLLNVGGLSFVLNGLVGLGATLATLSVMYTSLFKKNLRHSASTIRTKSALILGWTSLAAIGLFVATNHYYAVDARYLAVTLFTGFVMLAIAISKHKWRPENLVVVGMLFVIGMLASLPGIFKTYHVNAQAVSSINERNSLIAQVLERRQVDVLVGDYWRVVPTRQVSKTPLTVMPLQDCTTPRDVLSSQAWQPSLQNHRFAYLLSLDKPLTDYPQCSFEQVIAFYGRPNTSVVVAGNLNNPKELLLFYDQGAHNAQSQTPTSQVASIIKPLDLVDVPRKTCAQPATMNIVAHQDDDLLFMSPDLIHDIKLGHCVRTVYVTAGDAGGGRFYWLGRQQGSEAAYSQMIHNKEVWVEQVVKIANNQFITIASPKGNNNISLIFMHLPDGNLHGQGFHGNRGRSLANLESGAIAQLEAVDSQSIYAHGPLVDALATLIRAYQPTEIHTHAEYSNSPFPDHSDHSAVGRLARQAYEEYNKKLPEGHATIPLKKYMGYPTHGLPDNVFGVDLIDKQAAFFEYAKFDGGVCPSVEECRQTATYWAYLHRQYIDNR
jgi:LmbE family N-acetylglucosaminyl deacetylase